MKGGVMGKLIFALGFLVICVGGGLLALASWNIPAPTGTVEKVLPDEAFPR